MDKEELDLLEIALTLAIGECAYDDIDNIQKLEDKIKTINNLCKKQKEVIDRASARLEYFLIGNLKYQSSQEEFIKLVNILKEVSE